MGALLWATTGLWAHGGLLPSAIIAAALVAGTVFLTGQLPPGMRNPVLLGAGLLRAFNQGFTLDGDPLKKTAALHQVATDVLVFERGSRAGLEKQQEEYEPGTETADPALDHELPARPALSAVQRLILGEQPS